MFLITDSESTHKVTCTGKFLGRMSILWRAGHQILILAKILFLLFANSCIGSGPNRPRILIRHSRKYPRLIGILFFLIFEIHYVRHSLPTFRQSESGNSDISNFRVRKSLHWFRRFRPFRNSKIRARSVVNSGFFPVSGVVVQHWQNSKK